MFAYHLNSNKADIGITANTSPSLVGRRTPLFSEALHLIGPSKSFLQGGTTVALYAVSKLFGEDLGKYFSEQHKIKFIGLRIGWIVKGDDPTIMCGTPSEDYLRSMYLSHRDCIQAFERALESSKDYLIAYAISNNSRKVFDLKETSRTLNFYPEDDSENYFMNVK